MLSPLAKWRSQAPSDTLICTRLPNFRLAKVKTKPHFYGKYIQIQIVNPRSTFSMHSSLKQLTQMYIFNYVDITKHTHETVTTFTAVVSGV